MPRGSRASMRSAPDVTGVFYGRDDSSAIAADEHDASLARSVIAQRRRSLVSNSINTSSVSDSFPRTAGEGWDGGVVHRQKQKPPPAGPKGDFLYLRATRRLTRSNVRDDPPIPLWAGFLAPLGGRTSCAWGRESDEGTLRSQCRSVSCAGRADSPSSTSGIRTRVRRS